VSPAGAAVLGNVLVSQVSEVVSVVNVIIQGENLTKETAFKIAKQQVEFDCEKDVFKRNKLKYMDTIDVTDRAIISVEYH
jgi:hypothetical protein